MYIPLTRTCGPLKFWDDPGAPPYFLLTLAFQAIEAEELKNKGNFDEDILIPNPKKCRSCCSRGRHQDHHP